jgi:hypothetical protein
MCRLGFRSVIPSQVVACCQRKTPRQTEQPASGWLCVVYVDGSPHLTKHAEMLGDQLFHRLSGVVASETVLHTYGRRRRVASPF